MATIAHVVMAKYPGINLNTDCILQDDGAGPYIAAWNRPEPQPTIDELLAWAEQNKDVLFEPLRQSAREQAEQIFYQLAEQITGETINPLIIQEWQAKEQLVKAWIAAGKPEPTADNEFSLAYYEAQGDPNKTPSQLMEVWTVNATKWRQLNVAYIAWRQGFRARLKAAATEAELETIHKNIEPELRQLLQLT